MKKFEFVFEVEPGFWAVSFGIGFLPSPERAFRVQMCLVYWLFTAEIRKKL
jgi:hypothetical protein